MIESSTILMFIFLIHSETPARSISGRPEFALASKSRSGQVLPPRKPSWNMVI